MVPSPCNLHQLISTNISSKTKPTHKLFRWSAFSCGNSSTLVNFLEQQCCLLPPRLSALPSLNRNSFTFAHPSEKNSNIHIYPLLHVRKFSRTDSTLEAIFHQNRNEKWVVFGGGGEKLSLKTYAQRARTARGKVVCNHIKPTERERGNFSKRISIHFIVPPPSSWNVSQKSGKLVPH